MSWVLHNGLGCPVPWNTIVETVDGAGEHHVGRADDNMNVCQYGNSWIWEDEQPSDCEIVKYRIIKQGSAVREVISLNRFSYFIDATQGD